MTERGGLRLVHAIHDFLPRHRAGSEIYAASLARELARRHHVTVVTTEYDLSETHGDLRWRVDDGLAVIEIVNNWQGTFAESYAPPLISRRLEQILDTVRPDILHVHSLLNLSFDLPAIARRRGIEVAATLHDYTLVCASGGQRVHRADEHVCHEIEPERCARCFSESVFNTKLAVGRAAGALLPGGRGRRLAPALRRQAPRLAMLSARAAAAAAPSLQATDISARLDAARAAMTCFSCAVSPSRSLADEYRRQGMPSERLHVSDYGFAPMPGIPRPPREGRRLRAAYVGSLVWHKGLHVLIEAMRQLPDAIELTIYGSPDVDPDYVAGLRRKADGRRIRFADSFTDPERRSVLAAVDILVVPSLWLENSPLVIHEAFMAGVPVIASRMGGIEELVDDGINGLLVPAGSPDALAIALRRCAEEPGLLEHLSAVMPPVKTIADDAAEWEARYRQLLEQAPHDRERPSGADVVGDAPLT
jgi:glycosyltransferase involved in cell wall biosynthesis